MAIKDGNTYHVFSNGTVVRVVVGGVTGAGELHVVQHDGHSTTIALPGNCDREKVAICIDARINPERP